MTNGGCFGGGFGGFGDGPRGPRRFPRGSIPHGGGFRRGGGTTIVYGGGEPYPYFYPYYQGGGDVTFLEARVREQEEIIKKLVEALRKK